MATPPHGGTDTPVMLTRFRRRCIAVSEAISKNPK